MWMLVFRPLLPSGVERFDHQIQNTDCSREFGNERQRWVECRQLGATGGIPRVEPNLEGSIGLEPGRSNVG
jgi:hypothetical protein